MNFRLMPRRGKDGAGFSGFAAFIQNLNFSYDAAKLVWKVTPFKSATKPMTATSGRLLDIISPPGWVP